MIAEFIIYTIKCLFCFIFFYLFNKILLDRETFHSVNRWVWLGICVLSLTLPLSNIAWINSYDATLTELTQELTTKFTDQSTVLQDIHIVEKSEPSIELQVIPTAENSAQWIRPTMFSLCAIYLLGVIFFTIRLSYTYIKLLSSIRSAKSNGNFYSNGCDALNPNIFSQLCVEKKFIGVKSKVHIIIQADCIIPYNWMNYIFISKSDFENNPVEILRHELSHIRHRHSFDILFIDLILIFQWFNPALWLLKSSIQQVHEYQADEDVIKSGIKMKEYQLLLIRKSVGIKLFSMVNGLNYNKLKNRITMMSKEKSSPWAYIKYAYVLPLAFTVTSVFASATITTQFDAVHQAVAQSQQQSSDPIYIIDSKIVSKDYFNKINTADIAEMRVITNISKIKNILGDNYKQAKQYGVIEITLKTSLSKERSTLLNNDIIIKDALQSPNLDERISKIEASPKEVVLTKKSTNNKIVKADNKKSNLKSIHRVDSIKTSTYSIKDNNKIVKEGSNQLRKDINPKIDSTEIQLEKDNYKTGKLITISNNKTHKIYPIITNDSLKKHPYVVIQSQNDTLVKTNMIVFYSSKSSPRYASTDVPMIVIDEKIETMDKLYELDPNIIESFFILNDKDAEAKYGEKAIHGVIVVKTRAL